jgi:hypothetical protein
MFSYFILTFSKVTVLLLSYFFTYACQKAWYGRNGRKVTSHDLSQFIIVYTCKPHMNYKYSLVIITPRTFSSKRLYFGWWERSWLNLYDRYDHTETRLYKLKGVRSTSFPLTSFVVRQFVCREWECCETFISRQGRPLFAKTLEVFLAHVSRFSWRP